jgi:hypothetical protein
MTSNGLTAAIVELERIKNDLRAISQYPRNYEAVDVHLPTIQTQIDVLAQHIRDWIRPGEARSAEDRRHVPDRRWLIRRHASESAVR